MRGDIGFNIRKPRTKSSPHNHYGKASHKSLKPYVGLCNIGLEVHLI